MSFMKDEAISRERKQSFLEVFKRDPKHQREYQFLLDNIKDSNVLESSQKHIKAFRDAAEKDLRMGRGESIELLLDFFELMFLNKMPKNI